VTLNDSEHRTLVEPVICWTINVSRWVSPRTDCVRNWTRKHCR